MTFSPRPARSGDSNARPPVSRLTTEQSNAGPSIPRHRDDSETGGSPSSRKPGGKSRLPKTPKSYAWTMPMGSQSLPIFDPDYPDGSPACNSPRDLSQKRDYFEVAALHDAQIEDARRQAVAKGADPDSVIPAGKQKEPISEISVFGRVGDLEDVFGVELPAGLPTLGGDKQLSRGSSVRPNVDGQSVRSSWTH